jgi:hypothetical protein
VGPFQYCVRQPHPIQDGYSILSNSSHFEWRVELSDTILKWYFPRTIPARFGLFWFSGFRGKEKFFFQPIYTDYAN